jgi:hypothetical protein
MIISGARAELAAPAQGKPQDLTGLSLEELLHEDITPINVLGSHTHLKGGFMVGYRYMFMDMAHNQNGTRDVSDQEVLSQYPVVHTKMEMQMHMVELMYAPTDWATVEAMLPYGVNEMHHLTRTGDTPVAHSSGIEDLSFMGLFNVLGDPTGKGQRLVLNAGFTAPTGAIDATSAGKQLEYNMQLGSGTWDLLPGVTYLGESEHLAWGAQAMGNGAFRQKRSRLPARGSISPECLDTNESNGLVRPVRTPGLARLGEGSRRGPGDGSGPESSVRCNKTIRRAP